MLRHEKNQSRYMYFTLIKGCHYIRISLDDFLAKIVHDNAIIVMYVYIQKERLHHHFKLIYLTNK